MKSIIPPDYNSKYDIYQLNLPGCVIGMDPCQTFAQRAFSH